MSKKSKGKKVGKTLRHNENSTIRYRLKQTLERVDRTGIPIPGNQRALAKAMIESGAAAPPMTHIQPPPAEVPNNVLQFRAKAEPPVSRAGNEAEALTSVPAENSMKAKLKSYAIHDVIKAEAEAYQRWHHRSEKGTGLIYKQGEQWHQAELEHQRFKSEYGHYRNHDPQSGGYAPPATVQKGRPVTWYNQQARAVDPVSNEQVVADTNAALSSKYYTPSGLPISEFITGKYKPQDSPVVYTTLPPTPAKEWRAGQSGYDSYANHMRTDPGSNKYWQADNDSRYDQSVQVRNTPTEKSWVYKTNAMVQWFINHTEPQNWPTHVHNFVTWKDDGPIPNTGAINKAASNVETDNMLVRALYEGLEKDHQMIDSALAMAAQEVNLLNQELVAVKEERRMLEYMLAQQSGDYRSAEIIAGEVDSSVVKSKTPQIPDDADVMLAQFNTFNSFVKCDGLEHAFARYVYGDPRMGDVIREHADMRCNARQVDVQYRNLLRCITDVGNRILSDMQAEYEKNKHDEYASFWQTQYPLYLLHRKRRNISAVCDPSREAVSYAAMSRKSKPATERSIYYSAIKGWQHHAYSEWGKWIISQIQPSKLHYNNPSCVDGDDRDTWHSCPYHRTKYEQWWEERADYCELRYHETTATGRVKIGVVKTYNRVVDTLNIELNPLERKRKQQRMLKLKDDQRQRDEIREHRAEQRKQRKLDKQQKQRAKALYRAVH